MQNKSFFYCSSKKRRRPPALVSPFHNKFKEETSCIDITTLEMLDLRFYILQGKVAEVAKMNLSLKLYILTNVIGVHSVSCEWEER